MTTYPETHDVVFDTMIAGSTVLLTTDGYGFRVSVLPPDTVNPTVAYFDSMGDALRAMADLADAWDHDGVPRTSDVAASPLFVAVFG